MTVLPTRDDPVARASSPVLGGPAGDRVAPRPAGRGAIPVALVVACLVFAVGLLVKAPAPCRADGWPARSEIGMWTQGCYTDIPFLFRERGLADGAVLYLDEDLEYPVLTGLVMQLTAYPARALSHVLDGSADQQRARGENPARNASVRYYDVTSVLLWALVLGVVLVVARTVPARPWDGLLIAAAPVVALTATINWDLLAVLSVALAVLAWTRDRPVLVGLSLGLGTAAKLYPALLLGPLLLVCLRAAPPAPALRRFAVVAGAGAAAWVAANLPLYLVDPAAWRYFWQFNRERPADLGSVWYAASLLGRPFADATVDEAALLLFAAACAGIAALSVLAPQPPRLAQLALLTVAAFVLVNKVWSPQYALWLLPLAVLARPRWRDLLVWQAGEAVYFAAIWLRLATAFDGLSGQGRVFIGDRVYAGAVGVHVLGVLWLCAVVVRDVLRPSHDPVRPGLPAHALTRASA